MFIVCKENTNGSLTVGTPPKIHGLLSEAVQEAERLAGTVDNAHAYRVFKCVAVSQRETAPVKTTMQA